MDHVGFPISRLDVVFIVGWVVESTCRMKKKIVNDLKREDAVRRTISVGTRYHGPQLCPFDWEVG